MSLFNIALLQLSAVPNDPAASLAKGESFCRQAAQMGAQLALFPEMWNIGYSVPASDSPEAVSAWQAQAVTCDCNYVRQFQALAGELGIAIGLTYLEARPLGLPANVLTLIDRRGECLMTYAKVHTCDWDPPDSLTQPGDGFEVVELDSGEDRIQVGTMICFDREFPESARVLMLMGAEVILVPNCCDLEMHRLAQLRTRAYENQLAVACANYAHPTCNGHSVAYGPIAFTEQGESIDNTLVEAGDAEGIYMARLDMGAIRAHREREVWGNAYRKPEHYGMLLSDEVRPPFVRSDSRRAAMAGKDQR